MGATAKTSTNIQTKVNVRSMSDAMIATEEDPKNIILRWCYNPHRKFSLTEKKFLNSNQSRVHLVQNAICNNEVPLLFFANLTWNDSNAQRIMGCTVEPRQIPVCFIDTR